MKCYLYTVKHMIVAVVKEMNFYTLNMIEYAEAHYSGKKTIWIHLGLRLKNDVDVKANGLCLRK